VELERTMTVIEFPKSAVAKLLSCRKCKSQKWNVRRMGAGPSVRLICAECKEPCNRAFSEVAKS
jgi:hypothetical protein